jgi:hypothetical protein
MLRVKRNNVMPGELDVARLTAHHIVDPTFAPTAFRRPDDAFVNRSHTMWLGSDEALGVLGLRRGTAVLVDAAAWALQGRHAVTGAQVLPVSRIWGVTTFELVFSVPNSVSWVWSRQTEEQRVPIEHATMQGANAAVSHLAMTRPVIGNREPATGFAAFMVLHATVRRSPGTPPPLLHVHCHLIGVTDGRGVLRAADPDALTEETLTRECGAFGRRALAEELSKQGLGIRTGIGPGQRYFEIDGVPPGLIRNQIFADADCHGPVQEALYARQYEPS